MKIIYDNIIYAKSQNGGISNYWFELTKFLLNKNEDIAFFEQQAALNNFHRKQLPIKPESIIAEKSSNNILSRLSPVKLTTNEYFLYHSSYYRPVKAKNAYCEITTIHDFTHNFYSSLAKQFVHNKLKYSSIKNSNGIICISKNTYKDLLRFCPPKKNQKVEVIYNGVSPEYFKIDDLNKYEPYLKSNNITGDFLLFVGSRANYKNFYFAANLLKQLPNLQFVVVGAPFNENELKVLGAALLARTIVITNAQNSELNILYNNAKAFIYPSSYEGFGIPVAEAMKAGCPVLALNNSSIPEVAGDAALLFDTLSINDFKSGIENLSNKDFRKEIIEKGFGQSKKFSWQKCCEETYAFYKENYNN
ncbi:glycosyltransferase family 1 protein [Flavobacterium sp. MK4S-17]|uniref:glycosyltransferase family 4 protein n=1 Tax=Flavobacterium sp. MK4S-17 TaxID=2543737 RepID=UPI00135AF09E|nr:glycosyltransferase family 1 protein [Flavobacterium sp. MK4S-17]